MIEAKFKKDDLVTFDGEGEYKVIGLIDDSRTVYEIEDIERGKGWDEEKEKYLGVKIKSGWYLGKNNCFGERYTAHQKRLTKYKKQQKYNYE